MCDSLMILDRQVNLKIVPHLVMKTCTSQVRAMFVCFCAHRVIYVGVNSSWGDLK